MIKRVFSVIFSLILVLGMIPFSAIAQDTGIAYQVPTFIDEEHPEEGMTWETKYCTEYTNLSDIAAQYESNGLLTIPTAGWYVLDKDLKFKNIKMSESGVNIILQDGKKLTVINDTELGSGFGTPGIRANGELSIYGQEGNSGTLEASPSAKDAISGTTLNFYGGHIIAKGDSWGTYYSSGIGSYGSLVNIYGGNIEAHGGEGGPGIASYGNDNKTHLNIYGGTVYAEGGLVQLKDGHELSLTGGPGIGGVNGYGASGVNIYGGDVTAKSVKKDAGIGGSGEEAQKSETHDIKIYGGNVTAIGNESSSGIGVGKCGSCNGIYIYGGNVDAKGGSEGAGIGGGNNVAVSNINIEGGNVTTTGGSKGTGIGTGFKGSVDGIYISGGTVVATGGNEAAGIGGSYQSTVKNVNISGGNITAKGGSDASGIGGGKNSTAESIIISDGEINAIGGSKGAGIGAGYAMDGSNITISGGTIVATGGKEAAGIGGSYQHQGSNIIIEGGEITANGGEYAAGIGGGKEGEGNNISISGGTVVATGGKEAAGIGGGNKYQGNNISIDGGDVTANGGEYAAGIGGGKEGAGNNISISDGIVVAKGGAEQGAGIGGGDKATADNIVISGGQVTASANNGSAGIGAGRNLNCGSITITGGVVDAQGGYWAPGIGSGCSASSGTASIEISNAVVLSHAVAGGGYPAIGLGPWSTDGAKCDIAITGESNKVFNFDTMDEITDGQYGTSSILITNGTIIPRGIKVETVEINSSIDAADKEKLEGLISKFDIKASGGLVLLQSQMKLVQKILELSDEDVTNILADPNQHIDISVDFNVTVNDVDFSNSENPYIDYALNPIATARLYSGEETIKENSITLTPDDFATAKGKLEVTMPVPEDSRPTMVLHTGDGGEVYNEFSIDDLNCEYDSYEKTVTVYIEHCSHVVSYFESASSTIFNPLTIIIICVAVLLIAACVFIIVKRKKKAQ